MIFNWGANGSGTRPLRQGFVIVTLQTVITLRLRYSDRIREKSIANQYLRLQLRRIGAGGSVLRSKAPGHLHGYRPCPNRADSGRGYS